MIKYSNYFCFNIRFSLYDIYLNCRGGGSRGRSSNIRGSSRGRGGGRRGYTGRGACSPDKIDSLGRLMYVLFLIFFNV